MSSRWQRLPFSDWSDTRETLHAHSQVLGKLAVVLAPPEPQLQHGALRLSARGLETLPLPAPDGSGALVVALDLHSHEAVVEHSDGRDHRLALTPDRPVGEVTRALVEAVCRLGGEVTIDPTPQEVTWTVPLDEDEQHRHYEPDQVAGYFRAATQAALALAAFRAPYRGRTTPVNAWWGSFDLAVSLFSGQAAEPPGATSSLVTRWTPRRWRSAGGPAMRATPRPRSTPMRIPRPRGSRMRPPTRGRPLGRRPRRIHPGLGRRLRQLRPARRQRRVRPLSLSARVRRLRVGSVAGHER